MEAAYRDAERRLCNLECELALIRMRHYRRGRLNPADTYRQTYCQRSLRKLRRRMREWGLALGVSNVP